MYSSAWQRSQTSVTASSIEGAATILKREPHSLERNREFLDIIQKECRRLNRMLTNFLDVAKPRPPQFQWVDAGKILDSVIGLTGHAAGDKRLILLKRTSDEPVMLECDPEQLKQVLLNLTLNAIHAMPDGGEITPILDGHFTERGFPNPCITALVMVSPKPRAVTIAIEPMRFESPMPAELEAHHILLQ